MSSDFFFTIVFGSLEIRKNLTPKGFYDLVFIYIHVMTFPKNK